MLMRILGRMDSVLQAYGTVQRPSGVTHFLLLPGAIALLFRNGAAYLYTESRTGEDRVRNMRRLALQGHGLSTYVRRHVGDRFAEKLSPVEVAEAIAQARVSVLRP